MPMPLPETSRSWGAGSPSSFNHTFGRSSPSEFCSPTKIACHPFTPRGNFTTGAAVSGNAQIMFPFRPRASYGPIRQWWRFGLEESAEAGWHWLMSVKTIAREAFAHLEATESAQGGSAPGSPWLTGSSSVAPDPAELDVSALTGSVAARVPNPKADDPTRPKPALRWNSRRLNLRDKLHRDFLRRHQLTSWKQTHRPAARDFT